MKRRKQRGFTLVEMMISLLISTLLVIMILSIFARLSFSYREQQQIVSLQQSLAAARQAFEQDAKQAGMGLAQGFTMANPANAALQRYPGVQIINNTTAPDQVAFYYADSSKQAAVLTGTTYNLPVTVDSKDNFVVGDVVVVATADTMVNPLSGDDAFIARFLSCTLQIASITGTSPAVFTFTNTAPWGSGSNGHCLPVQANTMIYKFVAHGWRIDTSRPDLAPLQLSNTGFLFATNTFTDQAYGFSDLQLSTYFFDGKVTLDPGLAADTADPDTDGLRDWYSSTDQATWTTPRALAAEFSPTLLPTPIAMTISLVNRTAGGIEGITTSATPQLTETSNTANNPTGDRASVALPSATDPMLMGNRIYRFITFQVDLRNMGVGL